MKGKPISQSEVLAWLQQNYPKLWSKAEADRAWLWLPVDLRGQEYDATRKALGEFGFRYARKGHLLPSGKVGTWAHHCTRPLPFRRGGGATGRQERKGGSEAGAREDNRAEPLLDGDLLAEIGAALASYGR